MKHRIGNKFIWVTEMRKIVKEKQDAQCIMKGEGNNKESKQNAIKGKLNVALYRD